MNKQLVSSLVDVVLNLSPEDQKLFQAQLQARQLEKEIHNHSTVEKVEQFRQWVAQFPKSTVSQPTEAMQRETTYGDRGT